MEISERSEEIYRINIIKVGALQKDFLCGVARSAERGVNEHDRFTLVKRSTHSKKPK